MQFQQLHQHQIEVDSLDSGNLSSVQPTFRHLIDFVTVQHQVGCESVVLIKKDVRMQNPTLSTLERISQGLGISMEDLFKDIDTPINVENAAIRHLSQVISELSPEQTQQLLQIVDSVMAIKNEYL